MPHARRRRPRLSSQALRSSALHGNHERMSRLRLRRNDLPPCGSARAHPPGTQLMGRTTRSCEGYWSGPVRDVLYWPVMIVRAVRTTVFH